MNGNFEKWRDRIVTNLATVFLGWFVYMHPDNDLALVLFVGAVTGNLAWLLQRWNGK
jgi:hypothetical protein